MYWQCIAQVHLSNILSVTCPQLIKMPHLCLHLMGKEACMARPAGGAVQIDWQLLSPVTAAVEKDHLRFRILSCIVDFKRSLFIF